MQYDCWACGTEGSYHVRIDKRGRGYWACGACSLRLFVHTGRAFVMAGEIGKAVTTNRETWREAVEGQMKATFGDRAPALMWKSVTHADLKAVGVVV